MALLWPLVYLHVSIGGEPTDAHSSLQQILLNVLQPYHTTVTYHKLKLCKVRLDIVSELKINILYHIYEMCNLT